MNTIHLIISSPDGSLFEDDVLELSLRGANGDLAVMANHVPFITSVKPGKCKVVFGDNTEKTGYTDGGLLTVSKEAVTLFAGGFEWKETES